MTLQPEITYRYIAGTSPFNKDVERAINICGSLVSLCWASEFKMYHKKRDENDPDGEFDLCLEVTTYGDFRWEDDLFKLGFVKLKNVTS